ncbi:bifunctional UDP-N-acetylglucosamine diphosphorylase/glucosamine-1-phosphate N-acetyltransferase GlmU [Candidatus Dependentiae bacterium]
MLNNVRALVLAAGRSTRFNTDRSKLLYTVCGLKMILYPLKVLESLNIPMTIIIGYQGDQIQKAIEDAKINNVTFVTQQQALGTGNAVAISNGTWDKDNFLILNGDLPLLNLEIIQNLINQHQENKSTISFISAHCLNPFGYGRVIREGKEVFIVEEKNCTQDQKFTTLINAGIYLVSKKYLNENISKLKLNEISKEFYLTDLVNLATKQELEVNTVLVPYDNVRGVNTLEELWAAEQIKRSELMKYWMSKGVRFELAQSIHVDYDVEIGTGSFIGTGAHLLHGTKVGKNCVVNAFTIVDDSIIGDNSNINSHTIVKNSKIGCNVQVGPFARIHRNVVLDDNVNIGNFVELKNSKIGKDSKAKHLTYIGDTRIGKKVNVGAGTITCNYDGTRKHRTIIENNAFIGSNNTLIAPVKIGESSYTAGGSTINKDVPSNSLAIGRSKQQNKKNYFKKTKKNEKESSKLSFIGATKSNGSEHNL